MSSATDNSDSILLVPLRHSCLETRSVRTTTAVPVPGPSRKLGLQDFLLPSHNLYLPDSPASFLHLPQSRSGKLTAKVLQGVLDGQLDVLGVVVQLKQLGGDENLLAGNTRVFDALADFGFVAVGPGAAAVSALLVQLKSCIFFRQIEAIDYAAMQYRSAESQLQDATARSVKREGDILDVAVARLQGVLNGLGDFSGPVHQLLSFSPSTRTVLIIRWIIAAQRCMPTHLDCQVPRPTEGIS